MQVRNDEHVFFNQAMVTCSRGGAPCPEGTRRTTALVFSFLPMRSDSLLPGCRRLPANHTSVLAGSSSLSAASGPCTLQAGQPAESTTSVGYSSYSWGADMGVQESSLLQVCCCCICPSTLPELAASLRSSVGKGQRHPCLMTGPDNFSLSARHLLLGPIGASGTLRSVQDCPDLWPGGSFVTGMLQLGLQFLQGRLQLVLRKAAALLDMLLCMAA